MSIGWWSGPWAKTASSPAAREYMNLAPAASYVPGALTANSPFIMYEPLVTFNAGNNRQRHTFFANSVISVVKKFKTIYWQKKLLVHFFYDDVNRAFWDFIKKKNKNTAWPRTHIKAKQRAGSFNELPQRNVVRGCVMQIINRQLWRRLPFISQFAA